MLRRSPGQLAAWALLLAYSTLSNAESPSPHDHWAFQPLSLNTLPQIQAAAWAQSPVDHYILARLEKAGLDPNPAASRQALIRRLSYDLRGLPPLRSARSSPTRTRRPMRVWWIGFSHLPVTGNAGVDIGSMWSVMPTATTCGRSVPAMTSPKPIAIVTGWYGV